MTTLPSTLPLNGSASPTEARRQLAVEVTRPQSLPRWLAPDGKDYAASLPTDSLADRMRLANLMNSDQAPLADQANKTLLVEHMLAVHRELEDEETGEVISGPRVTLVTADGHAYSFSGIVPMRCLERIVLVVGRAPWKPALPIIVRPWSGGHDKKSVRLEIDIDAYARLIDTTATEPPTNGKSKR